jgi:hypothetical protein
MENKSFEGENPDSFFNYLFNSEEKRLELKIYDYILFMVPCLKFKKKNQIQKSMKMVKQQLDF